MIMLYTLKAHCLQVIVLKVDFEYKYEAHLRLSRQRFNDFLHQHLLLRLLTTALRALRRRLILALPLHSDLHLNAIEAVVAAGVHHGK